jgi:hypothetical protein
MLTLWLEVPQSTSNSNLVSKTIQEALSLWIDCQPWGDAKRAEAVESCVRALTFFSSSSFGLADLAYYVDELRGGRDARPDMMWDGWLKDLGKRLDLPVDYFPSQR